MMSEDLASEVEVKPTRKPFWRDLTIRGMMALVAVLALLFSAIAYQVRAHRMMREAGRRIHCGNNLKQFGLAIHNYVAAQGTFPAGTVANPDLPIDRRLGWAYLLSPYLELRGPFAEGDLARPWDDPYLKPLNSQPPSCTVCPTDPNSAIFVGIAGLGVDAPKLPQGDPRAGVFGDNRVVTLADIADGLSQTMMVADSTLKSGPWFAGGRNTVRGLDPTLQPYIGPGRQFGGIHGQGSLVLMADGSVKYVKDSVAPIVLEAMSTMAGGEKVSVP